MFNLIRKWIRNAFNPNRTSTVRNPAQWFLEALGGSGTDSGVKVDGRAMLSYAPMWYSINRISGHVGLLPCPLKQLMPDEDIRYVQAREFPEINLVNRFSNVERNGEQPLMTAGDLRECVQHHAIVHGNGRAAIVRNGLGQAVELIPLLPQTTQTLLVYVEGKAVEKWHHTTTPDGRMVAIPDRDVLHIKGLADDGLVGYSLVAIAKESIGGALAAEKYVNRSYRNGANPSIVLEAPEGAFRDDKHAEDFLKLFHSHHGGLDKVNRPGLLRNGVTAKALSQSNTDAQFLENRRLSREEAALWTGIESMLGVEKAESYNSLQQRNEAYKQNCLARWLHKWEQELDAKLLSQRQILAGYFWQMDTYGLLSGSTRERYETLQIGRTMGLLGQKEARRLERLGKMDPTDDYGNPNTSSPASSAGEQADEGAGDQADELDDEGAGDEAAAIARREVFANLAHERAALLDLAATPGGFLGRVEGYYDRVEPRIVGRLMGAGCTNDLALEWIERSKNEILEATGSTRPDDLADAIAALCDSWARDRAPRLLEHLGAQSNGKRNLLVR